ncbi:MAG: PQQ-dependent sugar dehydrogenase [Actinomycetota bacterium]|nr:PQQ-dependent sugar dehydrogenase [Actinomycetota bacterium]
MSTRRSAFMRGALFLWLLAPVLLWSAPAPARSSIAARPVATGLDLPATFTFAPNGKIFYGELLSGEIHLLDPRTGADSLFFNVPEISQRGEQGLLGIALHPRYPSAPYVYAFATRASSGFARNEILRIADRGGRGSELRVLFSAPAREVHNGGRIAFGPDRNLYVVIGDAGAPWTSQDLNSPSGKVLRMTAAGAVPRTNPVPGSYVYAYGIRNSFGFAFDRKTGGLWLSDNGPECNDEVNRITPGANYGWGASATCSSPPNPPRNTNRDGQRPTLPQLWYGQRLAPTGTAFCRSCGLGRSSAGRLFLGTWRTREIRRVTLGPKRRSVRSHSVVYTHRSGVFSMEAAPNGALYFSGQDAIYRLVRSR